MLALAINGFASPGTGGVNLHWISNSFHGSNLHGLFLGVVFAIFAITGWDAAAPLAEESRDPKRTVPRAVLGSILIMGVFLVLVSWGQTTGWGTSKLARVRRARRSCPPSCSASGTGAAPGSSC